MFLLLCKFYWAILFLLFFLLLCTFQKRAIIPKTSEHILEFGFKLFVLRCREFRCEMLEVMEVEPSKTREDGASVAIKKMFVNFYNRVREMLSKS